MLKRWVHIIENTRCSWLHGDPRGFRNRDHRIHSSGDYKHRPPPGEHEGLHRYQQARSGDPIHFDTTVRLRVVRAFVIKLVSLGHRVIAASCSDQHLHAVAELPASYAMARKEIGKAKQAASHAIRDVLPGSVWAAGGTVKRIRDLGHFRSVYPYIRCKQVAGSVVWSYRPDEDWIADEAIGAIVMGAGLTRKRMPVPKIDPGLRSAQTPASERSEDPDSTV